MNTANIRTLWSIYHTDAIFPTEDGSLVVKCPRLGSLLVQGEDKAAFRARFEAAFPERAGLDKTVAVSLLYRFAREMRRGDLIVYRSYADAQVRLGEVTGDYAYLGDGEHRRDVTWRKTLPQSRFSAAALREIGYSSPAPLFPVKCHADEFLDALGLGRAARPAARASSAAPAHVTDPLLERFVLDELGRYSAYHGFKEFAAGLLQAMGYRVTLLASARDDIDMIAHRDPLLPRVLVKVAEGEARVSDVQALRRAQEQGDYGVLLSLSGLSGDVRAALDAAPNLRGVDGRELAALTLEYYPSLHERYRRLIPLKSVYVPVA